MAFDAFPPSAVGAVRRLRNDEAHASPRVIHGLAQTLPRALISRSTLVLKTSSASHARCSRVAST